MAAPPELRTWISDQLQDLLGLSERTLVDFVIAVGQKAKSADAILKNLHDADLPQTPATAAFARELFRRTSRGSSSRSTAAAAELARREGEAKKRKRELREEIEKAQSYGFVAAEEDEKLPSREGSKRKDKERSKDKGMADSGKDRRRDDDGDGERGSRDRGKEKEPKTKRLRRRDESEDEEDEGRSHVVRRHMVEAEGGPAKDEEVDEAELERERDLRERDEFAERLRLKDEEKTKKVSRRSPPHVCPLIGPPHTAR